ncbi:MAG TPA: corrinoid protein [Chitinophagaceae bacterium]|nr:corrinoid protein [Chitinophagaceae bacterium]
MESILDQIAYCIEFGKVNHAASYPPELKGQPGADELTKLALQQDISPDDILQNGFIMGMDRVGKKFAAHQIFVPQMLMSAKAMNTAMVHLKPYFQSGEVKKRGTFIIGTVAGDLHEIGKNLAAMIITGNGWEVIDLGKDVRPEKFIEIAAQYPGSIIGLSALLTTTMVNMKETVRVLKLNFPQLHIIVGGAPVNEDFSREIGADFYAEDPQKAVEYLKNFS